MKWQDGPIITCPSCGHTEESSHGRSRYVNHGCRCDICTAANTEVAMAGRRTRTERLAADPTLAEHGRRSTYTNWGCRCEPCTEAHSLFLRERRASA